jgi:hypothetical protein
MVGDIISEPWARSSRNRWAASSRNDGRLQPESALKDVVCEARYAICRRFCPRAIYPYWREIWLERVSDDWGDKD